MIRRCVLIKKISVDSKKKSKIKSYKYVANIENKMYVYKTMYSFILTKIIRHIKSYNDGKDYGDFTLECDDANGRCYSKFLHNDLEKSYIRYVRSIKNKKTF